LSQASAIRERARQIHEQTGGETWTKSAYLAARQQIDRLIDTGRFREAVAAAQSLSARAEAAGDDAYEGADYDRAMTQATLARALQMDGQPQAALEPLSTARTRFESLAETMENEDHRRTSARMASVCLTEEADCLRALGQLDPAAAKYEDAINRSEKLGNLRHVAVGKGQLGTVRMWQERYDEALSLYHECRVLKEALGESAANEWHNIGVSHEQAGNLEEAESAYQKSLAMEVQAGNKHGEATSRNQLGSLYNRMEGRQEEAVQFFRQAAEIYADPEIADRLHEGMARNNAASVLIRLGRLDEARRELTRALECKRGLGPNATMWKTWGILRKLETAAGNAAAAAAARRQAMAEYEKARRQGWQIAEGPAV
jgi:tetratricopeptide (TPR) repeat protein